MKKLSIGILGTRGIPNHYGGFEQFAEHLSVELVRRGHHVAVYNSSLHPYKKKSYNDVQIIHCRDLEDKLGTAGQFIYDLNCINDSRSRGFDVLLHLGYTSDSVWHWRWPKGTVNVVNMDGMEWQRTKYNKPVKKFLRWAESLAAKNAQVMIADSPGVQDYITARYGRKPVYIPYGAQPFSSPDSSVPGRYNLSAGEYFLMITRMEPENNVEMIIEGHLASGHKYPLLVIGNITNNFGRFITSKYRQPGIRFCDAIYDQSELDNLRYYSALYFHGHTVGGTNPSLLEAMACRCRVAAHHNQFNRAVLLLEADYFQSAADIAAIINAPVNTPVIENRKQVNIDRLRMIYNPEKITDEYEYLMLSACGVKSMVVQPAAAAV